MEVSTLRDYIELSCEGDKIFESSVQITQHGDRKYKITREIRPASVSQIIFNVIPVHNNSEGIAERELVGLCLKQHLEDRVYAPTSQEAV